MQRIILTKEQVHDIIQANKYKVDPKSQFLSRCIDGRYPADPNLPPLAISGADPGELVLLAATSNVYGFEIDLTKSFEAIVEIVGGVKNIQMHSDHYGDVHVVESGCGYMKHVRLNPESYAIELDQIKLIKKIIQDAKNHGAKEIILDGDHQEGAVVIMKGLYSAVTQATLDHDGRMLRTQIFTFHDTLVNKRHRELVKSLVEKKAIKLLPSQDEEYLYQVLLDMTENHLMETAKRVAKGLPIYLVSFEEGGTFKIEDMGKVE